jgi:histidinol-phosphate aminotransferase
VTLLPARRAPSPREYIASLPHYVSGSPAVRPDGGPGYKLSSNESPYPLPVEVLAAMAEAGTTANRYPASAEALKHRLAERHGLQPSMVHVSGGSLEILRDLLLAFTGSGTSVVHGWRSYEAYPILVQSVGARSISVPLTEHRTDLDRLAAAIRPDTRAVLVANPNNPTGTVVEDSALEVFADAMPSGCLLVLDQAYCEFNNLSDGRSALRTMSSRPHVVVLRTFSKAYALAGMRVGWCAADAEINAALDLVALPFTLTGTAQAAAMAALDHEEAFQERVRLTIAERTRVRDELLDMGFSVPPSAANFVWIPLGQGASRFATWTSESGVSIRCFDGDGVRVTIGAAAENDSFLEAALRYTRR